MRGDTERVQDMLDACRMLRTHLGGRRDALEQDPVAQAAAQRWIEIIGMRHILADGYFDIDPDVIWNVIDRDAAALEAALAEVAGD